MCLCPALCGALRGSVLHSSDPQKLVPVQELASITAQLPLLAHAARLQLHPAFGHGKPGAAREEALAIDTQVPAGAALRAALAAAGAAGTAAGPRGVADFAPQLQLQWLLDTAGERVEALVGCFCHLMSYS